MGEYEDRHLRDCLKSQARLCERIAASTWDDEVASRLEKLAQECRADANPVEKKHRI
jgi:hypothetical protein